MGEYQTFWGKPEFYKTIQYADIDKNGKAEFIARTPNNIYICKYNGERWVELSNGPGLSDSAGWNNPQYYETIQCADIDGDGKAELIARSSTCIQAWKFNGNSWEQLPYGPGLSDSAGWNNPYYYETIQCADIDGDGKAELIARYMDGIHAWRFNGNNWVELPAVLGLSDSAGWNIPYYYETIQCADIDGDGKAELIARGSGGIGVWRFDGNSWVRVPGGPAWSDKDGWYKPEYYETIQCADIDGDGKAELIARSATCIQAWKFNGSSWEQLPYGPGLSDSAGWNNPYYYETIQCADIDGDGKAELIARSATCIQAWKFKGSSWEQLPYGPGLSDSAGWNAPQYYETIQFADINGDGKDELIALSAVGIRIWEFSENNWRDMYGDIVSWRKYIQLVKFAPRVWLAEEEEFMPSSVEWAFPYFERFKNDDDYGRYWIRTKQTIDPSDWDLEVFKGNLESAPVYSFWIDKGDGEVHLAYFNYYPYNRGKRIAVIDTVIGNHVGDWEYIVVKCSQDPCTMELNPYSILLSAHDFSNEYEWAEISKVDNTHPEVYSAKGSHGIWKDAGNNIYNSLLGLTDVCGKGTAWDTWNKVLAYDFLQHTGIKTEWPAWLGTDYTNPGFGDPSIPGNGPIYRWGNEKQGVPIGAPTLGYYYRLENGPTGPLEKSDL